VKKVFSLGIVLFSTVTLAACGDSSSSSSQSSSEIKTSESVASTESSTQVSSKAETDSNSNFVKNASDASFDGTILKGNSYSVKITDYKVIQPGEAGNEYGDTPVIAFWYDTMVAEDYDNSTEINPSAAWIMNFKAMQDNDPNMVNELSIASLPDQKFLKTQTATIKPGGTVSNAVAYTLTDTETPVTLEASSIMGDSFGSKEFSIK
jgi:hypothetical protein